jgi:predicted GNAT superfamily acetyltransferase
VIESSFRPEEKIVIRTVQDARSLSVCVDLQQQIWGFSEPEIVPEGIFLIANHTGGQVLVAYAGERPAGFALSFAAWREGRIYLHSHMVGVLPAYQNQGIGRLLKLRQRDDAIARNIDLIEWTFDPLQLKNARFNISKLGAIVRQHIPDFYGRTSSPLHAGLPTDRLVAEWRVRSSRVASFIGGVPQLPGTGHRRIDIPAQIREICLSDPQRAAAIQSQLRTTFKQVLAEGYTVTGFEMGANQGTYLLERLED